MQPSKNNKLLNGWLNIYKEEGYTSNQVLSILKKNFFFYKIGHYGTLDPMASGVLPIALGEATKTIKYITYDTKIYIFTIKWGEETDTCDKEGKIIKKTNVRPIIDNIKTNIKDYFLGKIRQKPPKYSAVKINGKRAYQLARNNIYFETKFKEINIFSFKLKKVISKDLCQFEIECSPGTYIRSIARDLATKLGTLGHAAKIIRKKNSYFYSKDAHNLKLFLNYSPAELKNCILPMDFVLKNYKEIELEKKYSEMLKNGKIIFIKKYDELNIKNNLILVKSNKKLVSIANLKKGYIIPQRNFNN